MLVKLGDCYIDPERVEGIYHMKDGTCCAILGGGSLRLETDDLEAELVQVGLLEPVQEVGGSNAQIVCTLSEEERQELVKFCKMGFRWLAVTATGTAYVFHDRPQREGAYWNDGRPLGRCLCGEYAWLTSKDEPVYIGGLLEGGGD